MEIRTVPTPNLQVTTVRVPAGDISLDTGIKLLIEMLNEDGLIVNKKYLEIPQLPNLIVKGKEVPAVAFLKEKLLEVIGLEEYQEQEVES